MKDANAEERIWKTQFAFRTSYGMTDALFMIRRIIDKALASKHEVLIILAMDWAKAFDSISPDALCLALARFGVSARMTAIIKGIYIDRIFNMQWDGHTSQYHT